MGENPGYALSQGEILGGLFTLEGYPVRLTSVHPHPLKRLVDIVGSLLVWRNAIDIVVLEVFSGRGFILVDAASIVARSLRLPLIQVLHGGALPQFAQRYPGWARRVLGRAHRTVSPSGYLAHFFSRWGFNVSIIPNVLQLDDYPYRQRFSLRPHLLWMRSFHTIYHPEMAIGVLNELWRQGIVATLTMAGQDKGSLASVRNLATANNLDEQVFFPGFLSMEEKQRIFDEHDIYLNTNRVDNMPVSVVEACAFGLPVIATSVGGIPHLLHHEETALLVDNEDVSAMARAVVRLLTDAELVGRLSRNGRALAERCAWSEVRGQWEALFREICADG